MRRLFSFFALLSAFFSLNAQPSFRNPVLHMDYSDPDVCRVGEDYFMTASSFNCFPGLPILHSRDLVHWNLVGAALTAYDPVFRESVQHGNGAWAPAIRYHEGWFYIYCGDPDRGIFMVRTKDPAGRWEDPVWLIREKGFIDPCPFWDEDGNAYLSHACAGSRAGLKSVVFVAPMHPDGTRLTGPSRIVFDGHLTQPTIEGTKMYKRNGLYYIFAPAGGVATGWQTVLRSENPWGPYEERIVMAWAPGCVNGPHQGAWVEGPDGRDWFLHFQDKGAYGRIVHLQPLSWRADGWPLVGEDPDGDGVGQPVAEGSWPDLREKPKRHASRDAMVRQAQNRAITRKPECPGPYGIGLEWQYPALPSPYWHSALGDGGVRLYSAEQQGRQSLWDCRNLLLQKFPAESFTLTARLSFCPNPALKGEEAGFVVMGNDYALLRLTDTEEGVRLEYVTCPGADKGGKESVRELTVLPYSWDRPVFPHSSGNVPAVNYPPRARRELRVKLEVSPREVQGNVPDAVCRFSYSLDGRRYELAGEPFTARPEMWVGARFGFFCNRYSPKNDAGWLDVRELEIQ